MDAYDKYTNLRKNLADSVAIYGRGRELFRPPMYFWTLSMARTVLGLNPGRDKKHFVLQNVEMGSGTRPAFNSGGSERGVSLPSVTLNT